VVTADPLTQSLRFAAMGELSDTRCRLSIGILIYFRSRLGKFNQSSD
jgi:hypothetical protein